VKTTEVEEARSINRRENVEFKVGDFFELEAVTQYDVVVALDIIEHMPVEQGHKLTAAVARHLKPNGMAVIGTPSIYSHEYQGQLSKASHVKCYDQQELVALVENYFGRTLVFSMNDELVHTGFPKMAWYYFVLAFVPH
jgi:2-polyprenyl-3-methyl-5-hydroxy-6-metoxy-1,4-benzoquinol methylase